MTIRTASNTQGAHECESKSGEDRRLAELRSFDVLDTAPEATFDECVRLAAAVANTPTALISLLDGTRQWFKARVGLEVAETPRNIAFCDHAIRGKEVFVVEDASKDSRFAHNPLVTEDPRIRFYAGAPLITRDGYALGTICVIDYVPHEFTVEQREALTTLSSHVMAQLDLRRSLAHFVRGSGAYQQTLRALRRALDRDEFALRYHPTVDLRTRRIEGLEALIRWNCPERGLLHPKEFLPALEDSGLIVEVGIWVMQRAAADFREWLAAGLAPPRISVNISPQQLRHPDFVAQLTAAVDPGGVARVPLDLEITEAALMEQRTSSIAKLEAARRLGSLVAIDDFGSGYSSFRSLGQLPIDALKIDRGFVLEMTERPEVMGLVSSIITLAHGLRLEVVAEGVSTEAQRKLLRLLRCDRMQGYLFTEPLQKKQAEAMLRADQAESLAGWRDVLGDVSSDSTAHGPATSRGPHGR